MGQLILGDNQQPGGVKVQAMDDAWADFAAHAADVGTAGEQGIYQRAIRVAGAGMDCQPGGLVDYGDVGVFVDDGDGDVLGFQVGCRLRRRNGNYDHIAGSHSLGGPAGFAIDGYVSGAGEGVQAVAGEAGISQLAAVGQPGIEARRRRIGDHQFVPLDVGGDGHSGSSLTDRMRSRTPQSAHRAPLGR